MKIISAETINDNARKQRKVEQEKENAQKLLENIQKDINKTKESLQGDLDSTRESLANIVYKISSSIDKTSQNQSKDSAILNKSIEKTEIATKTVNNSITKLNTELVNTVNELNESLIKNKAEFDTKIIEKKLDDVIKVLEKIKDKKAETKIFGGGGGGSSVQQALIRTTPTGQVLAVVTETGVYTERYDYSDATTIYTGIAPLETAEASTGWTITKYDLTDTSNASGKVATDVSWLDKAIGDYK